MLKSLRFRITLIFIGLAVGPLILVGAIIGQRNYDSLVRQSLASQHELAASVGNEIRAFIEGRENELLLLNKVQGLEVLELEEQRTILGNLLLHQQVYQELALLDAEGQEQIRLARSGVVVDADLRSRAERKEFLFPATRGQTYFSPVRFDETIREPLITISVPLVDLRSGEIVSVLVADLRFRAIWDLLASLELPGGGEVYVADQAGRVVAHRNPTFVLRGTVIDLPKVDDRAEGLSGVDVIVARDVLQFGDQELVVVAEQPVSQALELAIFNLRVSAAATLATLAVAVVLVALAARRIVRPIEALAASARAISGGDFSRRVKESGRDEVGELARAFNSMSLQLQELLAGLKQEIKERRQVERSLHESEQKFRSIIERSPDGITLTDEQGSVIEWNQAAAQITGLGRAEVIGRPLWDVQHQMAPQERRTRAIYEQIKAMSLDLFKTGQAPWLHQLQETEIQHPDGTRGTMQTLAFVIQTGQGYRAGSIMRDVTESKQAEAEIRRLNEELEQRVIERTAELTASNKELEAFAYSVSHDLRAPLRSMNGFSYALLEDYADKLDPVGQDYLRRVRAASQRMGQLIDDLLALSRLTRGEIHRESVDLSALARDIIAQFQEVQQERQVEFIIAAGMVVNGDARLLRAMLQNLLGNAWKFTSKHPQARIEFGVTQCAGERAYFVRDDGVGFDMAYADKLFGAFQRLHGMTEFEGTGIGLATVQRIIHRHGGHIWAEAAVNHGATFYFTLQS